MGTSSRSAVAEPATDRRFLIAIALLVLVSTWTTVVSCGPMSAMDGMPWMRMPGQSWLGAGGAFLFMWSVMMVAMKAPSLLRPLQHYRQAVGGEGAVPLDRLTLGVGVGYFAVWIALGAFVFPVGAALFQTQSSHPALAAAMPFAHSAVLLGAGVFQCTAWKARQLTCCRGDPATAVPPALRAALHHGLRLGVHCVRGCAGLMAVALVLGVMDLRVMAGVGAVITLEHLLPAGERCARAGSRAVGALAIAAGVLALFRVHPLG